MEKLKKKNDFLPKTYESQKFRPFGPAVYIYIYIQCLALLYRLPSFDLDCLDERGVAQIIDNLTGI